MGRDRLVSASPCPNDANGRDDGAPDRDAHERELLLQMVDTLTDYAIFVLDLDGRVASWNAGAETLKGYQRDEILGRHFSVFYPTDATADGIPDRELAIATSDGRNEDEGWRVRKDGTTFWANVVITAIRGNDGRLLGFGKVTRDLTERRRGEQALRESEQRFRLLVSSVSDYAIFLLTPEGLVASWNRGAERLKGYAVDEILGQPFTRFYTEEDLRNDVPATGLAHALEHGRWEHEGWRVRRDGTRFWADVVITALHGQDGAHQGFAKVTQDLTDRKRNEDALRGVLERERDASARLTAVDRMRTELVAMVAHDLRSPVGVVANLIGILSDEWPTLDDSERSDVLDRAASRVAALGEFIDDAFDLAQIEAGQLSVENGPIDLERIVQEVVDDAHVGFPGRVVELRVTAGCSVLGDERRARQVFTNLLSNALKFSPADTAASVDVKVEGTEVLVRVADRGVGISDEQKLQLFQPFSRLPQTSTVPGSGLGLFIVRSLVEAQRGRIWVESGPSGSTFIVALPRASAET